MGKGGAADTPSRSMVDRGPSSRVSLPGMGIGPYRDLENQKQKEEEDAEWESPGVNRGHLSIRDPPQL